MADLLIFNKLHIACQAAKATLALTMSFFGVVFPNKTQAYDLFQYVK
jgi:hypothetical protein